MLFHSYAPTGNPIDKKVKYQRTESKDMGLKSERNWGLGFLGIGTTSACFHARGKMLSTRQELKICTRYFKINGLESLIMLIVKPSLPQDEEEMVDITVATCSSFVNLKLKQPASHLACVK